MGETKIECDLKRAHPITDKLLPNIFDQKTKKKAPAQTLCTFSGLPRASLDWQSVLCIEASIHKPVNKDQGIRPCLQRGKWHAQQSQIIFLVVICPTTLALLEAEIGASSYPCGALS